MPKTLCTNLNIRHQFGFVWEALQMTNVWSCDRLQHRCRYSKVLERLRPVNQAQPIWNCGPELCVWIPQHRTGKFSNLWPTAEWLCSF